MGLGPHAGRPSRSARRLGRVTLDGVGEHQAAFQKIADNSVDPVFQAPGPPAPTATPTHVNATVLGDPGTLSGWPVSFQVR